MEWAENVPSRSSNTLVGCRWIVGTLPISFHLLNWERKWNEWSS
jgi:hypothetical protein